MHVAKEHLGPSSILDLRLDGQSHPCTCGPSPAITSSPWFTYFKRIEHISPFLTFSLSVGLCHVFFLLSCWPRSHQSSTSSALPCAGRKYIELLTLSRIYIYNIYISLSLSPGALSREVIQTQVFVVSSHHQCRSILHLECALSLFETTPYKCCQFVVCTVFIAGLCSFLYNTN